MVSKESKEHSGNKERDWIEKLKTLTSNGYNISLGGTTGGSNPQPITIKVRGVEKTFKSHRDAVEYVVKEKKYQFFSGKEKS